jgi:hypothetical protein
MGGMMSYTEMYRVDANGDVQPYEDFHNAWRGAFLVWREMSKAYLGKEFPLHKLETDARETWDLWKNAEIPVAYRIVMAHTFDNVMIRRENFTRFIEAVEEYAETFDAGTLLEQAQAVARIPEDTLAICWNPTSVNCNPWQKHEICETCNQEIVDEYRPYNINVDERHWFLFDHLEE